MKAPTTFERRLIEGDGGRIDYLRGERTLLTSPTGNQKIAKNDLPTYSLNLAPARSSRLAATLCPHSTPQCRKLCLTSAGRNQSSAAVQARQWRTELAWGRPAHFLSQLRREIDMAIKRHDGKVGFRLNALADLRWELILRDDLEQWVAQGAVFYDYTKWPPADRVQAAGLIDLTYSATERHSIAAVSAMAASGLRVAVVSRGGSDFGPITVVNGDDTDFRPGEPHGVIVKLKPKGAALRMVPGEFEFVKP